MIFITHLWICHYSGMLLRSSLSTFLGLHSLPPPKSLPPTVPCSQLSNTGRTKQTDTKPKRWDKSVCKVGSNFFPLPVPSSTFLAHRCASKTHSDVRPSRLGATRKEEYSARTALSLRLRRRPFRPLAKKTPKADGLRGSACT